MARRAVTGIPSNTTTKTAPVTPAGPWDQKLDMTKLLPAAYQGYRLNGTDDGVADVMLSGVPEGGDGAVTNILWLVHDRKTAAKAAKFITTASEVMYPRDVAAVKVNGVPARFATDGKHLATVTYTRGRYVFEVVMTSAQSPVKQQAAVLAAATAFGTTP